MSFAKFVDCQPISFTPKFTNPPAEPARSIKETNMRTSLIILASIGSLVASSAAFAAAPYANTAAAPAVVKHQLVKKVSSTTPVKSIHKTGKKIQKVSMTHKKHRKPAVTQDKDASTAKAM
jgi:uncharacterized protein YcfJ